MKILANLCRTIAEAKGEYDQKGEALAQIGWGMNAKDTVTYRDDVICIVLARDIQALFVDKLDNRNPVLYITDEGEWLRQHGEFGLMSKHIFKLAREILDEAEDELDRIEESWKNARKNQEKTNAK